MAYVHVDYKDGVQILRLHIYLPPGDLEPVDKTQSHLQFCRGQTEVASQGEGVKEVHHL